MFGKHSFFLLVRILQHPTNEVIDVAKRISSNLNDWDEKVPNVFLNIFENFDWE